MAASHSAGASLAGVSSRRLSYTSRQGRPGSMAAARAITSASVSATRRLAARHTSAPLCTLACSWCSRRSTSSSPMASAPGAAAGTISCLSAEPRRCTASSAAATTARPPARRARPTGQRTGCECRRSAPRGRSGATGAASTSTSGGSRRVSRAEVRKRGRSRRRSSAEIAAAVSSAGRISRPSSATQACSIQRAGLRR